MNLLYFNIILTIGGDKTIFLYNFAAQTINFFKFAATFNQLVASKKQNSST